MLTLRSWVVVSAVGALLAACNTSPTQPSVTPAGPSNPAPGALACPAGGSLESLDGSSVPFTYPMPTLAGEPVDKSACAPASGSLFPAGATTRVTCEATEAPTLAAACSFDVSVVIRPRLGKTRFLAFGDSITEGFFRSLLPAQIASALGIDEDDLVAYGIIRPERSYPTRLLELLTEEYPAQMFQVSNRGRGGEETRDGRGRLAGELASSQAEVLLLLEGTNDLHAYISSNRGSTVNVGPTASNLAAMIDLARSRGVDVLIATLTPVTDHRDADWPGLQTGINNLNARIRSIAAARGVPVVDLYAALQADLSLLQNDGLHPTTEGYRKIAETVLRALITLYESTPEPQPPASLAAPRRN